MKEKEENKGMEIDLSYILKNKKHEIVDFHHVMIEEDKIKEEENNTYFIDMNYSIIMSKTKIYVGYAEDDINIIKIYKHHASTAISMIESVKMVNHGVYILNYYLFDEGDFLVIVLDKKLENKMIVIENYKRIIYEDD